MSASAILIPAEIVRALPIDSIRAALATLGLVLDGSATTGAELHEGIRTWIARWASDVVHDQRCADPGCARLPAILVSGAPYCAIHGHRRMADSAVQGSGTRP